MRYFKKSAIGKYKQDKMNEAISLLASAKDFKAEETNFLFNVVVKLGITKPFAKDIVKDILFRRLGPVQHHSEITQPSMQRTWNAWINFSEYNRQSFLRRW